MNKHLKSVDKQRRIQRFIIRHIQIMGYAPLHNEIRDKFRASSKTVYKAINDLQQQGVIEKDDWKCRGIKLL